jgi:hypothetical protein
MNQKERQGRNRWFWAAIGVLLIGGIVLWWRFATQETLEDAGRRIIVAIVEGDESRLSQYIHPDEQRALNSDEEMLGKILDEYVVPELRRAILDGSPRFSLIGQTESLVVSQPYIRQDGVRGAIGIRVAYGDKGPCAPLLVGELLLTASLLKYAEKDVTPKALNTLQAYSKFARQEQTRMSELGIPGIYRDYPKKGVITWNDFAVDCEQRVEKLKESLARRNAEGSG